MAFLRRGGREALQWDQRAVRRLPDRTSTRVAIACFARILIAEVAIYRCAHAIALQDLNEANVSQQHHYFVVEQLTSSSKLRGLIR
jgi:hypothetical protein